MFLIMSFKLKSKNNNIIWPLYILNYCLPIFFNTFFGQNFLLIITIFDCRNEKPYFEINFSCKRYSFFYALLFFSIIALIIHIFLSFITVWMYYKPDYIVNNKIDSVLAKRSSLSDISFLLCKIIIILIFIFCKKIEREHWGIIIIISLLTGFNVYCNLFLNNYSNITIKRFNTFLS